ncbi:MAG: hypothetical protein WDW38_001413 [Sanguina aurantia]
MQQLMRAIKPREIMGGDASIAKIKNRVGKVKAAAAVAPVTPPADAHTTATVQPGMKKRKNKDSSSTAPATSTAEQAAVAAAAATPHVHTTSADVVHPSGSSQSAGNKKRRKSELTPVVATPQVPVPGSESTKQQQQQQQKSTAPTAQAPASAQALTEPSSAKKQTSKRARQQAGTGSSKEEAAGAAQQTQQEQPSRPAPVQIDSRPLHNETLNGSFKQEKQQIKQQIQQQKARDDAAAAAAAAAAAEAAEATAATAAVVAAAMKSSSRSGQQAAKIAVEAAATPRKAKGQEKAAAVLERQLTQQQQQLLRSKEKGSGGGSLLDKMRARLQGGHFRFLNESLYTCSGSDALQMMQETPELFQQYHDGFQQQTLGWPSQPVDEAIAWLKSKPPTWKVADFGCGDAKLGATVKQAVHSFDLVATAPGVIACNMATVPLADGSVDAAVFSLALMGTDYGLFLQEASRVLNAKGYLWIAEVRSRFTAAGEKEDFRPFLSCLQKLGLTLQSKDADANKMFVVLVLRKVAAPTPPKSGKPTAKLSWPKLKACMYKKR